MSSTLSKLVIHAVVSLVFATGCYLAWLNTPAIAAENQLMENLQAACLGGALLLVAAVLILDRKQPGAYRHHGLAVLLLTVLLRELAVERMALPEWLILLGSGVGKNLLLGALWMTLLTALARNRHRLKSDVLAFLRSPAGIYLLATFACYLIGEAFDKRLFPLGRAELVFWEELAECLGTLCCLLGMISWGVAARSSLQACDHKCLISQTFTP